MYVDHRYYDFIMHALSAKEKSFELHRYCLCINTNSCTIIFILRHIYLWREFSLSNFKIRTIQYNVSTCPVCMQHNGYIEKYTFRHFPLHLKY